MRTAIVTGLVVVSLLVGCGGPDYPASSLSVSSTPALAGALVTLDGVQVGVLERPAPPPVYVHWWLALFGHKYPEFDGVAVVVDLAGIAPGQHTIVVQPADGPALTESFRTPDDLTEGRIFVAVIQPGPVTS